MLAGVIGPRVVARIGRQASLMAALAVMPVGYVIYALTAHPLLAGMGEFTIVFCGVLWNIVTVSYRQRHIPDALLGRVNALYRFFGWGSLSIGALISGMLVAGAAPELGRELALRLPFAAAALIGLGLLVYGGARLRLEPSPGRQSRDVA